MPAPENRAVDDQDSLDPKFWTYLARAMRLKCPECGANPMFRPLRQVRSLYDWFTPLDGCPRCGYAYDREIGYFLVATWVINYTVVAGLAVVISFTIDALYDWPMWKQVLIVFAPMPLLSFAIARHAKAAWIAMDHYFDPHRKTGA
jgi:uncharacterized protein (DUF983 family)